MIEAGRRLLSTLAEDGTLTVEVAPLSLPDPHGAQIVVRVEAAPINPSDLGVLFGPADTDGADYAPGRIVARMPAAAVRAMKARFGVAMPAGIECSGTVIAAGDDPVAKALLGRRVACVPGASFATDALCDAAMAMPLADEVSFEEGASSFVNPMTALGFVETMRRDGFGGIVHTAAASNLGQMLVRICAADGIPLVNVVRSQAQVGLLRELGSEWVLDSTAQDFRSRLVEAVAATGAMLAFDAVGGGPLAGQILSAMEAAASRGAAFSRYGSNVRKKVYIYGGLDLAPTTLTRAFGFQWELAGWLLTPFLEAVGADVQAAMRRRVQTEIGTTFASRYEARVGLEEALAAPSVRRYNARRTGRKFLLLPQV